MYCTLWLLWTQAVNTGVQLVLERSRRTACHVMRRTRVVKRDVDASSVGRPQRLHFLIQIIAFAAWLQKTGGFARSWPLTRTKFTSVSPLFSSVWLSKLVDFTLHLRYCLAIHMGRIGIISGPKSLNQVLNLCTLKGALPWALLIWFVKGCRMQVYYSTFTFSFFSPYNMSHLSTPRTHEILLG